MESLHQETSSSSDNGMVGMNSVSLDASHSGPLGTPALASDFQNNSNNNNYSNNNTENAPRTPSASDWFGDEDEFRTSSNSKFQSYLRYTQSAIILATKISLDLLHANNTSMLSRLVRVLATVFLYAMVYTTTTGMLLLAMAFLVENGWYPLAITNAMMLLFIACILLVAMEWMWLWQTKVLSMVSSNSNGNSYLRLRSIAVLDDDEMEDDLTLQGWTRLFTRILVACLVWSLYALLNVKLDFWITDNYPLSNQYAIVLKLVNCFVVAPIPLGAAILLYFAYPPFYRLNFAAYASGTFASSEEIDNEGYTIPVDDTDNTEEAAMRIQNLII